MVGQHPQSWSATLVGEQRLDRRSIACATMLANRRDMLARRLVESGGGPWRAPPAAVGRCSRALAQKRGDAVASPCQQGSNRRLGYNSHSPERLGLLTILFPIHIMRLDIVFHLVRKIAQHRIAFGTFRHLIRQQLQLQVFEKHVFDFPCGMSKISVEGGQLTGAKVAFVL